MLSISSLFSTWAVLCRDREASIAFPESLDPRVLDAVIYLLREHRFFKVYLFCSKEEGREALIKRGLVDLASYLARIVWSDELDQDLAIKIFHHIKIVFEKKGKKFKEEELRLWSTQAHHQAAYLLHLGQVDSVLAGVCLTTAEVIRAALFGVGMAPGLRTLSGAFLLERQDCHYLYADCAVTVDPSVEQLLEAAEASVKLWRGLLEPLNHQIPRLAFLSFSSKGSASHPSTEKMARATALFKERNPLVLCDGELQFDAAIDPAVAVRKSPKGDLGGTANIFMFPDLNSGNIAYKITQRLAGFNAYGPLLQGLAKPYYDLSRGATVMDIVACAYIQILCK
ncbi:MAG: hypothetical protein KA436_09715 [Oligoflexales bacterium]|nr:hypothetical protein [Oligoflexales bacterium]